MFTLIMLALYTVLILLFVPLDKIASTQTTVRKKWKEWTGRIGN